MTSSTALVYGVAVAGEATARALVARGYRVLMADDAPTDERRAAAHRLGAELVESPDAATIDRMLAEASAMAEAERQQFVARVRVDDAALADELLALLQAARAARGNDTAPAMQELVGPNSIELMLRAFDLLAPEADAPE